MSRIATEWTAHHTRRFMRPDARRFVREDARRFFKHAPNERVERKAGFNPDQARDEQGRWTDTGAGDTDGSETVGQTSEGGNDNGSRPDIPKESPKTTRELNKVARAAARRFGVLGVILDLAPYLSEKVAEIQSSFDPPKTLEELQNAVGGVDKAGYDDHHLVERNSRNPDGSEDERIRALENLTRIPRWKHWDLNEWYQRPNERFGGQTPREYLKGKSWQERRNVGLDALRELRILK